ncbi:hypothetical protein VTN77DRAFT_9410 [Rasamsonia byssochlamydoides]|uniref:uncharacterized protein n=1 Tax=Rasamsonia byssochlamydoides TaxID=89139 RepID=UPI003743D0CB
MHTLQAAASSSLSLPAGSYVYALAASPSSESGAFAAISSDDSLRVFDGQTLKLLSLAAPKTHGQGGVTCLKEYRENSTGSAHGLLATAGRDGAVRLWDVRAGHGSGNAAVEMKTAKNAPILSLACHGATNTVVAGTELMSSQASVVFWDVRSPKEIRHQLVESHNDDVTELQFHPTRDNVLLSGSTDGLVNIYDTTVTDEDDALLQVINHGSIHRAGFLSEKAVYALSHDEVFSIHPITDPDSNNAEKDPSPIQFGDLRQPLKCEYVVQTLANNQGIFLAAGNATEKRLDLFPIISNPKWQFDHSNIWRLPGAHGEEIVRTVYLDEQSRTIFTGGEDGFVRAWKPKEAETESTEVGGDREMREQRDQGATPVKPGPRKEKKKHKEEKRYKPY